ncbi:MAG: hypothetical protein AAFR52_16205 [Pseudomonadota bacterium]
MTVTVRPAPGPAIRRQRALAAVLVVAAAGVVAVATWPAADARAAGDDQAPPPLTPAIVAYTVTDGRRIEASLTGRPGDAADGLKLFADAARTGCIACHAIPRAPGLEHAGGPSDVAHEPRPGVPVLDRVGARIAPETLRLWLVAPAFLARPETMAAGKTSLYMVGQREDPADPLYGGPRLTAAEIEDMVAWLAGLTGND